MEPAHRVSDRGAHPLHLMLASLVEGELDLRWRQEAGLRPGGRAVVELDALGEAA